MDNEGEMYHAAATVSTLLLKLGEVTRKFQLAKPDSSEAAADTTPATSPLLTSQLSTSSSCQATNPTDEWFITFEQLIASLLTDNLLVQYFDARFDINSKLTEYKSQHA